MRKLLTLAAAAGFAAGLSAGASAYEQGDIILRLGAATVAPNEDSDNIGLPSEPPITLPGIGIDNDTQLGITATWMFSDRFGVELLAATPFEHDFTVKGLGIDGGSLTHLPPTLSLQWYPRGGQSGWQPYVGIGVNYTYIYDEEVSGELKTALSAVLGASRADLSLDNSFGPAAQVGVDIPLGDNLGLNLGVWYLDIDTTATISTDVGRVKFDVDVDPWVYNVGLAWRF
ncbi:OmpW/AlkL family protein [Parahaliea mediterranea]|uniref:Outer membrane beta-barrel protein n=1 Tax=Parahaliea mediterranea TaxID=651086 RepID=A0A939DGP1_9GAMM|nr:OmpW family outer membrane protein [Parahaliea mediterranea]MBN7797841.1 outer membrane beta-barrel protein [Parahaliea mediterranea]